MFNASGDTQGVKINTNLRSPNKKKHSAHDIMQVWHRCQGRELLQHLRRRFECTVNRRHIGEICHHTRNSRFYVPRLWSDAHGAEASEGLVRGVLVRPIAVPLCHWSQLEVYVQQCGVWFAQDNDSDIARHNDIRFNVQPWKEM